MHSVSAYEVPRDKRQRQETPVQPISSVLPAQPDAMAIGPVGVIGCRLPLTSRAKGRLQAGRTLARTRSRNPLLPSLRPLALPLSCSSASAPRPLLAPRPLSSSGHLPLCQSILSLPSLPSLTSLFLTLSHCSPPSHVTIPHSAESSSLRRGPSPAAGSRPRRLTPFPLLLPPPRIYTDAPPSPSPISRPTPMPTSRPHPTIVSTLTSPAPARPAHS